jgi:hypothetical protein
MTGETDVAECLGCSWVVVGRPDALAAALNHSALTGHSTTTHTPV